MLRPRCKDGGTNPDEVEKFIKENGLRVLGVLDNTGLHCSKYTKKVRADLLEKSAKRRLRASRQSALLTESKHN